jgi:hypothetical protein
MPPGRLPAPDHPAAAHMAGTARASAVVRGLLRTGRARPRLLSETGDDATEFIALEHRPTPGARYWVRRTGAEIRVGCNFATAEALQPGFLEAMERAGATLQKSCPSPEV